MNEIVNSDLFVTNILNKMSDDLTDEQLINLKNLLYVNLHNVQMQKEHYELVLTDNNDVQKIEWFIVSEKST